MMAAPIPPQRPLVRLSEERRQKLGEALTEALTSGAENPDWCDSREIDRLIVAIEATLIGEPESEQPDTNHSSRASGVCASKTALRELQEMREHGDSDDVMEAAARFEKSRVAASVGRVTWLDGRMHATLLRPLPEGALLFANDSAAGVQKQDETESAVPAPSRELLESARDALEYHQEQTRPIEKTTNALAAIRAHLEGDKT